MEGGLFLNENDSPQRGDLKGYLPRGEQTERFINQYPQVAEHFDNVGCRIEGHRMGEFPRLVLVFPGMFRTEKDRTKSIEDFWTTWVAMPLERSFAQITYSNHSFVPELMYSQVEDLIKAYGINEIDMIAFSFGGPLAMQQIVDFYRKGMGVDIKTISLIMTCIEGKDLTALGKGAGKIVDFLLRIPISLKIPSAIFAHTKALGVRTGSIGDLSLDRELLPKSAKVLMLASANDELFNSKKSVENTKSIYPEAKIVWLPGGHAWNNEKTKSTGNVVYDFLKEE